ncbi:uncharacterized protein MONOS_14757 [Monocercomonoides exilis]|uniref:uncharacterized protein n=1 Tax=Monocercomonoides exilis TaxID=2049356 RepID=UPI003559BC9E|nr:hypothetical protein MONOS_14757 [Monocercomonoides exilis]|eukprot:MONOS_14757.1-p1 / transcript=MONOS_14757.1 / gene=MONOS_14757 / organism=Monocercomonoides_exilis_PA203 / gene_product=unspecified product / transcript_product=unspecified product / location=Mono_scaffold01065:6957-7193(+) / protein_length=79 / sequence_SO=supercontig / SO=protein_coding / is_pseudo=false
MEGAALCCFHFLKPVYGKKYGERIMTYRFDHARWITESQGNRRIVQEVIEKSAAEEEVVKRAGGKGEEGKAGEEKEEG